MREAPLIERVAIKNFKSIASCDVQLKPLTVLAGPNGSGKSNFLEALRFLSRALAVSLEDAVATHGGWDSVVRRGAGGIEFEVEGTWQDISIRYGAYVHSSGVGFEECVVGHHFFRRHSPAEPEGSLDRFPTVGRSQFLLAKVGDTRPFGWAYRSLTQTHVYNPPASALRQPSPATRYRFLLDGDARNLAEIVFHLQEEHPELLARATEFLQVISPGVNPVRASRGGLSFYHLLFGEPPFEAKSMSDGTLRALALLVALYQVPGPTLIGIEEPEAGLHPASAEVLIEAMREASSSVQVVATTHSPEMLDALNLDEDRLLIADRTDGQTRIGPIDEVGRDALKKRLYSLGQLLRYEQLQPGV
ncbi:MAG: AAA family ATPase [Bryobacteraceae bacterium]|nr:AAA family ATPase [Bryobacteraceae bacterium]